MTKNIPDGKTEDEIWKIFQIINELFEEGDTVIFDITHGFRSLPMLGFAVLNYAAHLKNIKVQAIYYGAYEAKNEETGIAPIFDLSQFSALLQWSSAADAFINYGYADKLANLVDESAAQHHGSKSVGSQLKWAMDTLNTVRGKEITEGSVFHKCVEKIKTVQNSEKYSAHPAFTPFFEQIEKKLSGFQLNNPYNFMYAAKLNLEYGREQQAVTLLQEGIITLILHQLERDESNRNFREIVARQIHAARKENMKSEKQDSVPDEDSDNDLIDAIQSNEFFKIIIPLYGQLSQLRNDINHAGYLNNVQSSRDIIKHTQEYYDKLEKVLIATAVPSRNKK